MKNIFLKIFVLLFLLNLNVNLFSQSVDINELKKAKKINFLNYRGPFKKVESSDDVKSIGAGLASISSVDKLRRLNLKYSVIRAISKKEKGKLSADIISIDKNAKVDHVKNIQRIISGYLIRKYGYSQKDAETLAIFTTYYNAVYRKDMDYFNSRYKKIVLKYVTGGNVGLSTKYYDWPGRTKIIIPLNESASKGNIDAISADTISDGKVKKEVRKDKNNLKTRKDLVDIKKKSIDKEKKRLEREKKEIARKKEELKKKEQDLQAAKERERKRKEELQKKKEDAAAKRKEAENELDEEKKKKSLEEVKKEEDKIKAEETAIKKEESKRADEEKKIASDQEKVAQKEEEVKIDEKAVEKKEENVKKEEKQVANDQLKKDIEEGKPEAVDKLNEKADKLEAKEEELSKREDQLRSDQPDENVYALKLYYLKINEFLSNSHYNNEMYMINPVDGKVEFKSPVKNICGRKYDIFSKGVVVITNQGAHTEAHHLTMLNRDTLGVIKNSKANVLWRSFVEIKDNFIYAIIIEDNGDCYLGKFDDNLELVKKSDVKISKDTFITFFKDNIFINRADKQILMLTKENLTLIKEIKP